MDHTTSVENSKPEKMVEFEPNAVSFPEMKTVVYRVVAKKIEKLEKNLN